MTFKREGLSAVLSVCIAVVSVMMIFGLSSLSEAANATTSGVISAWAFDETSILLSMPYTGDDNGDNTYTVQYKSCTEEPYTPWATNAPHIESPYQTTITGLQPNTCYDIETSYNDPDGVSGHVTQKIRITSTWDNTLLHNVNRFSGSAKWAAEGGWGLPGTKYGNIVCETCHMRNAPNIKRISGNISAPETADQFPGQAGGLGINFNSMTTPDGFGDDKGGHTDSRKICEYCHSQTTYHRYNTAAQSYLSHSNNADCLECHPHAAGFYYSTAVCDSCHGNPPVVNTTDGSEGLASAPPTGSLTPGAHSAHTAKSVACISCHYNSAGAGGTHRDGAVTLGFYLFEGAYQGGGYDGQAAVNSYNASTTTPATTVSKNNTKTCSNIYCHGYTMTPNGGTDTTPVWDSRPTGACGTCHGATASVPPEKGSHLKHAQENVNGYNYSCALCHKEPPVDNTLHVNNKSEVVFSADPSTAGGSYSGTDIMLDSYGTCTNVYCHSTVQSSPPGFLPTYRTTPLWGNNNSLSCSSCHLYSGASYPPLTGSHAKHFEYPEPQECYPCHNWSDSDDSCMSCHDSETLEPRRDKHANRFVDIAFAPKIGGNYSGTPAPGDAYGNCSNTFCHSNGTSVSTGTIPVNSSPTWGTGTLYCNSCHTYPPDYTNGSPKANSHLAHSAKACDTCHYSTSTDGIGITNYDNHVNRTYDLQGNGVSFTYTYNAAGGTCSNISCHGNSNAQWGDTLSVDSSDCIACHKTTNGSRRQIVDSNGDGSGTGGDFKKTSHHVQAQITASGVVTVYNPAATAVGVAGFTIPESAYTSNNAYATCSGSGNSQYYYNYSITLPGYSQTITKVEVGYEAFYTAISARTARPYISVSWDGGATWSSERVGTVLTNADPNAVTYVDFTSATAWDTTKLALLRVRVRTYFTGGTTTVSYDWLPVRVTYSYNTDNVVKNADCLVCHDMTQHMCGNVRLKDADTGEIYTYDPAHPATAENFCLSCHDLYGANGNMSPFSDGATIGNIPYKASKDLKTNWEKTYGHKQKGLTCLGDGSPNTGCHSNGHGADNVGLLSKNLTLPNLTNYGYSASNEGSYELCFSCHQNYPRVTKEAVLGFRTGGNYDILGDGPSPYNIPNIMTKFRDQNYSGATGKLYDDFAQYTGLSNLHFFHLQWDFWNYRDSVPSLINCISCHNVHGSNNQSGWVYDEMAYTHHTGEGSDEYGSMDMVDYVNLNNYPVNCISSCHDGYLGTKTYNWYEPSGE